MRTSLSATATRLSMLALVAFFCGCAEMKSGLDAIGIKAKGPGFDETRERQPIPYPSGPRLSDSSVVFYHQAFSATPFKIEDLLMEGRAAGSRKDEFTRRKALEEETPYVARRTQEARQAPAVYAVIATVFGEYDFTAKAFPTGIGKGQTYSIGMDNYYAEDLYGFTLVNSERMQRFPLPESEAQKIAKHFGQVGERTVVAVVSGRVTGASLGTPPGDTRIKRCMQLARQRKSAVTMSARQLMISAEFPFDYDAHMKDCKFEPRLVNVLVEKTEYYLPNGTLIGMTGVGR